MSHREKFWVPFFSWYILMIFQNIWTQVNSNCLPKTVSKTVKSQKNYDSLQADLDAVAKWESDWLIQMHSPYSNTQEKPSKTLLYVLHNHSLESVTSAKYQHFFTVWLKMDTTDKLWVFWNEIWNNQTYIQYTQSFVRKTLRLDLRHCWWNLEKVREISPTSVFFIQNSLCVL